MSINASILVFDELRVEQSGKLIIIGAYPANIFIPREEYTHPRLNFLLMLDLPKEQKPSKIKFSIKLPGNAEPSAAMDIEVPVSEGEMENKYSRFSFKTNISIEYPVLRAGKVVGLVLIDEIGLDVSVCWIALMEPITLIGPNASAPPPEQSESVPQG